MTVWANADLAQFAWNAGFPATNMATAVAVCLAESSGNDQAVNTNKDGSVDRGLWQINNLAHPEVSDAEAFDPGLNANAAFEIAHSGSGTTISFTPWSTYNSGAYLKFLGAATIAVAPYTGSSPPPRVGGGYTSAVRSSNKVVPVSLAGPNLLLPLIVTDLPISDDPLGTAGAQGGSAGAPYGIQALAVVPNGYSDPLMSRGLACLYGRLNTSDEASVVGGIHPPSGSAQGFRKGWRELPDIHIDPGSIIFGDQWNGCMAAQRQGEWIYFFARETDFDLDRAFIWKNNNPLFSIAVYQQNFGDFLGNATLYTKAIQAFVSDTAPVQVWLKCSVTGRTDTDEVAWFIDDQTPLGTRRNVSASGITLTGKFGAGYQQYSRPTTNASPSILVHPWRAGDYGPPEQWWFIPEVVKGSYTQRHKIYTSRFYRGQWQETSPGLSFTAPGGPGVALGDNTLNTFNPYRVGFERKFHYVGTIGPFPDFPTFSASSSPWPTVARVIRSRRRRNVLYCAWLAQSQSNSLGDTTYYNGGWWAVSTDDGKTWSDVTQMNPAVHVNTDFHGAVRPAAFGDVVVTHDDLLVATVSFWDNRQYVTHTGWHLLSGGFEPGPHYGTAGTGGIPSLLVLNYDGQGIPGLTDRRRHVFKQGEVVQQTWL